MPKKKWDNDGPRRSAQGYGWDWRYLQTIMMMSAASDVARKEVKVWWNFLDSHPDIKEDLRRDVLEVKPLARQDCRAAEGSDQAI